jgi:hypothetical protein
MTLPSELPTPAPSRARLAAATLISQLLAASMFVVSLWWIVRHGTTDVAVIGLVVGAVGVFAGGMAHRGGVGALVACSVLDLALAVSCLVAPPPVRAFVQVPLAKLSPRLVEELATTMVVTGVVAALAAIACLVALPQARRFATWRDQRVRQAAGVRA